MAKLVVDLLLLDGHARGVSPALDEDEEDEHGGYAVQGISDDPVASKHKGIDHGADGKNTHTRRDGYKPCAFNLLVDDILLVVLPHLRQWADVCRLRYRLVDGREDRLRIDLVAVRAQRQGVFPPHGLFLHAYIIYIGDVGSLEVFYEIGAALRHRDAAVLARDGLRHAARRTQAQRLLSDDDI